MALLERGCQAVVSFTLFIWRSSNIEGPGKSLEKPLESLLGLKQDSTNGLGASGTCKEPLMSKQKLFLQPLLKAEQFAHLHVPLHGTRGTV